MAGQFYHNADRRTYIFPAAALETLAIIGRFIGPLGKTGRVVGVEVQLTAGTTDAATVLSIGVNGAVAPASISIPVLAINLGHVATAAELDAAGAPEVAGTNDVELTADTQVEVDTNGGCTVGDGDLYITVDWF